METKKPSLTASIIKLGVILFAVTAIVALVLGFVDNLTSGRIALLQEEKTKAAMQAVLPADNYTQVTYTGDNKAINSIYQAGTAGWVVEVTETGSQGPVTMMVGVGTDLTSTGISITNSSETAGLGAIASQKSDKGEAFRSQFVGQSGTITVKKDGGTIDALSGATITSRAVCAGVTAALAACADLG
jgi:electron transport complex, RnfABCDGE type, G subunit